MKIPMKSQHAIPLQACLPWLVGLAVLGSALAGTAETKDKSLPSFNKVKEVVVRHCKSLPGYRPGNSRALPGSTGVADPLTRPREA